MRAVQPGPVVGLLAQLVLLAVLGTTVGLGLLAWGVGVACGVVTAVLLARGLARAGTRRLGPADRVTLVRATLVGGVAALVAQSWVHAVPVPVLVGVTVVALVLDAVDGWVARRTATPTPLGARFDMEVDAFLILVLSGYVAPVVGAWVLAIGVARYAYVAAGWVLPWLRRPVPPRYWRKVVAAIQGITLTAVAGQVLPWPVEDLALVVALALLAESFGWDVLWLWQRRRVEPARLADLRTAQVAVVPAAAARVRA